MSVALKAPIVVPLMPLLALFLIHMSERSTFACVREMPSPVAAWIVPPLQVVVPVLQVLVVPSPVILRRPVASAELFQMIPFAPPFAETDRRVKVPSELTRLMAGAPVVV